MRISDWSSDVCSSDLDVPELERVAVQLELEDGTTYGIAGHIDFLDLAIDEATGTAALRAEFQNPGRLLLPGQFVRARLQAGTHPNGILDPQGAVIVGHKGGTVMGGGRKDTIEAPRVRVAERKGNQDGESDVW